VISSEAAKVSLNLTLARPVDIDNVSTDKSVVSSYFTFTTMFFELNLVTTATISNVVSSVSSIHWLCTIDEEVVVTVSKIDAEA